MGFLTTRNKCNLKTTRRLLLDMILEILILLPAKSVLRFKCVCKEWCNLINNSLFAKLHLNKSLQSDSKHNRALFTTALHFVDDLYRPSRWIKLNWPKDIIRTNSTCTEVVGSCNGLVCLKITRGPDYTVKCFVICNPTTGTFKLILPSSDKNWRDYKSYGFGYDSEHDDYKIVVTNRVWTENDIDVRVYSVKADLWSYPTPPPTTRVSSGRRWLNEQVIYRNKMLHYLLVSVKILGDNDYRIARFDVVTEKWIDDLNLPQLRSQVYLEELDGLLYLRGGNLSREVWMIEEDGSWKKMFRVPRKFQDNHRLIARSKDGRHRLLVQGNWNLKWYDHQANKTVPFTLRVSSRFYSSVMFCIASLVTIPGCSSEKLHVNKEKGS
ncbi:F-box/kelch-repeat protein At3g23880-like [Silene latifolia]|uniref:F-box/kelch-repeat protein At3g23880-like n=1 Tax=Silene latifolia TaxID=37657 RepID=UPI003D77D8E5